MPELGFRREDIRGTFHEVLDYTVVEWEDGYVLVDLEVKPEHRNLGGSVHGGVLASLVDLAGFLGGSWSPDGPGRSVTINLNTSFVAGTTADVITAEGRRSHATRNTNSLTVTPSTARRAGTAKRTTVSHDGSGRAPFFSFAGVRWRRGTSGWLGCCWWC